MRVIELLRSLELKLKVLSLIGVALIISACHSENNSSDQFDSEQNSNEKASSENPFKVDQSKLRKFAENLIVNYQIIDNRPDDDCDKTRFDGNCFKAAISLDSPIEFPGANWKIYFSQMSPIIKDYSELFNLVHVQGDLHYLEPTDKFAGFNTTQNYRIEFKAGFWQISEYDSPPNFYIVYGDLKPVTISSTVAKVDPETGMEKLNHVIPFNNEEKQFKRTSNDQSEFVTANILYHRNKTFSQKLVDVSSRIIPKPKSLVVDSKERTIDISEGLKLNSKHIDLNNPAIKRLKRLGVNIDLKNGFPLNVSVAKKDESEAYELEISENQIQINADSPSGAFYAIQSLSSLYQPGVNKFPLLTIKDEPRYEFRGLHLDVSRNFRDKDWVIKLLDQMAAYKLNKLHLHLGDDEGWRVEIPGLPELTKLGAMRCHDLSETDCLLPQLGAGIDKDNPNNGYYSILDYQEILNQAKIRHIQVIPSFDMPGHSRAAVKSMQLRYRNLMAEGKSELAEEFLLNDPHDGSQYSSVQFYSDNTINVCRESSYHFLEKVVSEVALMHKNAGAPLDIYHIGADETPGAWKDSPQCAEFMKKHNLKVEELSGYFIERVSNFLKSQNIKVAGWNDGLAEVNVKNMPDAVQANAWTPLFWEGHKAAHTMANQGWDVVVSVPDATYFDFPYEADPKERGYYWGSRYTNTRQAFELMPDNLPIHAEIWTDRENNPYQAKDKKETNDKGEIAYEPLRKGLKFKGMQAHLWSEMVRSNTTAEYMLFPRLLSIAERAWHKASWEPAYLHEGANYSQSTNYFTQQNKSLREKDWLSFANTIGQKEMAKLEIDDWHFRLPTIGAVIKNNLLKVNSAFPGLTIEYSLGDNGWKPVPAEGVEIDRESELPVKVRAISPNGSRKGRSLLVQ